MTNYNRAFKVKHGLEATTATVTKIILDATFTLASDDDKLSIGVEVAGPTKFLMTSESSSLADLTGNASIVDQSGVAISTSTAYFGSKSIFWETKGAQIRYSSSSFNVGTGDFTWDAWVYMTDPSAQANPGYYQTLVVFNSDYQLEVQLQPGTSGMGIFLLASIGQDGFHNGAATYGSWHHIAIMRTGGTLYVGLNGSWETRSDSGLSLASPMELGYCRREGGGSVSNFAGYMDNIRFSDSAIFSTSSFTPPVSGDYALTTTLVYSPIITQADLTAMMKMPVKTTSTLTAITGQAGWMSAVSNSAGGGSPNGMMAFWDTTNSRWSYVHDNSAV